MSSSARAGDWRPNRHGPRAQGLAILEGGPPPGRRRHSLPSYSHHPKAQPRPPAAARASAAARALSDDAPAADGGFHRGRGLGEAHARPAHTAASTAHALTVLVESARGILAHTHLAPQQDHLNARIEAYCTAHPRL